MKTNAQQKSHTHTDTQTYGRPETVHGEDNKPLIHLLLQRF